MSSKAIVAFRREPEALFRRRVHWLMNAVEGGKPGSPPSMSRRHVSVAIDRMQSAASEVLANRLAKREFETNTTRRKSWHAKKGKGRGSDQKRASFNSWFDAQFGNGAYIYVFWRGKTCIYVGKTERSGRRISSHFEKAWFGGVTRVDVYRARGRRGLPALECLAMHRFLPRKNKARAGRAKWTRKCSLCKVHREIASEMNSIFRLR